MGEILNLKQFWRNGTMKKGLIVLSAFAAIAGMTSANLLTNGDFNDPPSEETPTGWTAWAWGWGWANHENKPEISYDGSYYAVAGGGQWDGGGGFYQIVPATEGVTYTLTVLSGADAWWLPTGKMIMFFLDAEGVEIGQVSRNTVDPAVYGENYDIPHPWESYSLTAMTPAGTTQIKVELACNWPAAGSVWFENAVLVPEPTAISLLALGGLLFRRRR